MASFLQGFTQGFALMDSLETNRERRLAWREDRAWQAEARDRTRELWGRQDEEFSRTRTLWQRQDEEWAQSQLKHKRAEYRAQFEGYVNDTLDEMGQDEAFAKMPYPEQMRAATQAVLNRMMGTSPEFGEHVALALGRDPAAGKFVTNKRQPVQSLLLTEDGRITYGLNTANGVQPHTDGRSDTADDPVTADRFGRGDLAAIFGPEITDPKASTAALWDIFLQYADETTSTAAPNLGAQRVATEGAAPSTPGGAASNPPGAANGGAAPSPYEQGLIDEMNGPEPTAEELAAGRARFDAMDASAAPQLGPPGTGKDMGVVQPYPERRQAEDQRRSPLNSRGSMRDQERLANENPVRGPVPPDPASQPFRSVTTDLENGIPVRSIIARATRSDAKYFVDESGKMFRNMQRQGEEAVDMVLGPWLRLADKAGGAFADIVSEVVTGERSPTFDQTATEKLARVGERLFGGRPTPAQLAEFSGNQDAPGPAANVRDVNAATNGHSAAYAPSRLQGPGEDMAEAVARSPQITSPDVAERVINSIPVGRKPAIRDAYNMAMLVRAGMLDFESAVNYMRTGQFDPDAARSRLSAMSLSGDRIALLDDRRGIVDVLDFSQEGGAKGLEQEEELRKMFGNIASTYTPFDDLDPAERRARTTQLFNGARDFYGVDARALTEAKAIDLFTAQDRLRTYEDKIANAGYFEGLFDGIEQNRVGTPTRFMSMVPAISATELGINSQKQFERFMEGGYRPMFENRAALRALTQIAQDAGIPPSLMIHEVVAEAWNSSYGDQKDFTRLVEIELEKAVNRVRGQ